MKAMFKELLEMTEQQEQPQRLLFLFAQPEGHNSKKSKKHVKGHIEAVMCVDKLPEELTTFSALIKEADSITKDWQFVFIAGLSGQNGVAPTTDDAEPYLNKMSNDLADGQDLGRYVILDRNEKPIEMAAV
mgnify:FL=1